MLIEQRWEKVMGILNKNEISICNKIETSIVIYIFLHYIIFIWICDCLNLMVSYFDINQNTIAINFSAVMLISILIYIDKNAFKLVKFDYKCLYGICFIFIISLYSSLYPDLSHDTLAYHVLNQEPTWYGNDSLIFVETSFPLPDRLVYLFRNILGYRLGTIFNCIVLCIIYIQLVRVLKQVFNEDDKKKNRFFNPYILGVLCVLLETVLMTVGTYMTDLTSIPLLLELIICLIYGKNKKTNLSNMLYFVVCLAFMFLMKLTTIIYIIPILFIYLWKNKKYINIKKFFICLCIGLIIIAPYLIYNFIFTGMPFFSFSLFTESKYVIKGSFTGDKRWGAQNWFEVIIWPFIMLLLPKYRHMELIMMPNFYPVLCLISAAGLVINKLKKKNINAQCSMLNLISIISLYIWIILRGVDRYAIGAILLCGISFISYLYTIQAKKWLYIIGTGIFFVQASCSLYSSYVANINWKFSPSIKQAVSTPTIIKEQINKIITDKGNILNDVENYDYFISIAKSYTSLPYLLNENAHIYELHRKFPDQTKNDIYQDLYEIQQAGNCLYMVSLADSYLAVIDSLANFNLQLIDIQYLIDSYVNKTIVLYKVELKAEAQNKVISLNAKSAKETLNIENKNNYMKYKTLIMVDPVVTWTKTKTTVTFFTYQEDKKIILKQQELIPGEILNVEINLDKLYEEDIVIYAECDNNWGLDWDAVHIVNITNQLLP